MKNLIVMVIFIAAIAGIINVNKNLEGGLGELDVEVATNWAQAKCQDQNYEVTHIEKKGYQVSCSGGLNVLLGYSNTPTKPFRIIY